ncbi:hypothetical protein Tco_0685746 [Tanacetum coccineum]
MLTFLSSSGDVVVSGVVVLIPNVPLIANAITYLSDDSRKSQVRPPTLLVCSPVLPPPLPVVHPSFNLVLKQYVDLHCGLFIRWAIIYHLREDIGSPKTVVVNASIITQKRFLDLLFAGFEFWRGDNFAPGPVLVDHGQSLCELS